MQLLPLSFFSCLFRSFSSALLHHVFFSLHQFILLQPHLLVSSFRNPLISLAKFILYNFILLQQQSPVTFIHIYSNPMGNVSSIHGVKTPDFYAPGNAVNEIWIDKFELVSRLPFGDSDMGQASWPPHDWPKIPWHQFIIPLKRDLETLEHTASITKSTDENMYRFFGINWTLFGLSFKWCILLFILGFGSCLVMVLSHVRYVLRKADRKQTWVV